MGYKAIPDIMIEVGRNTAQGLWKLVRNNFISHEVRISDLETQGALFTAGIILEYGGASAPAGWLLCDGSVLSRTTFADLFAIVGTTFNTGGEAGTDFRLPDMRGRAPMGVGTGAGLSARALGDMTGAETHQLTTAQIASHTHAVTDPAHTHPIAFASGGGASTAQLPAGTGAGTPAKQSNFSTSGFAVGNRGGDGSHNNMQPSTVLNFIIKA